MKEEIIKKYLLKVKNVDICKEYNISRYTLSKILKENNIHLKQVKCYLDDTIFKNIDTEEKAYWLGFLFADGYIRKRKSSELRLKLSTKDKSHLEKFKISIKSNTNIIDGLEKNIKYSYIGIYNKKIIDNLITHGCINKKSLVIKFPIIDDKLKRHFIRGYFDDDGSVGESGRGKFLNIVSGSLEFIKEIRKIIISELNVYDCKIIINKTKSNCYYINWTRTKDIANIYHYFYNNSNFFLDRKKIKFETLINTNDSIAIYKNNKIYIFKGEKNIIVIENNLEQASNKINDKIKELKISADGIIEEYNTNKSNLILI